MIEFYCRWNERERERERYKYDVIYIDPPYNTDKAADDGNAGKTTLTSKKFIYNDRFSRTGWLNFMKERLVQSRKLLKENGVIFISIDDTEHAYLKVLMDDIFGEENFVCNFIWQKKNAGSGADSSHIKVLNEYILMYTKNKSSFKINVINQNLENGNYNKQDQHFKIRGKYKEIQLDFASLSYSSSLDFHIVHEGISYYPGKSQEKFNLRQKGNHAANDWCWRWSKEKIEWGLKNDFLVFKNNKIYSKQYQYVDKDNQPYIRQSKFSNLILNKYFTKINGSDGTAEQKAIFSGDKVFDNPKPINLIKFLINLHPNKNAHVLDFFAGSGTTGHAILDLNREDKGKRIFTLVTNNENKIGEKITFERLYRIIKGEGTNQETNFSWITKNSPFNLTKVKIFKIAYQNISFDIEKDNINQKIINIMKNFIPSYKNNDINNNSLKKLYSRKEIE